MDKATALNATSADAATFAAEVSTSASIVSSTMFEATGIVIGDAEPAQGPGTVTRYYQMAVSDPAAYVAALKKNGPIGRYERRGFSTFCDSSGWR